MICLGSVFDSSLPFFLVQFHEIKKATTGDLLSVWYRNSPFLFHDQRALLSLRWQIFLGIQHSNKRSLLLQKLWQVVIGVDVLVELNLALPPPSLSLFSPKMKPEKISFRTTVDVILQRESNLITVLLVAQKQDFIFPKGLLSLLFCNLRASVRGLSAFITPWSNN